VKKNLILLCLLATAMAACTPAMEPEALRAFENQQIRNWNWRLTEVIIKDIFTPPVASRIYAYSNIAAYEALAQAGTDISSLSGKLNGLTPPPTPPAGKKIYAPVAALTAFCTVAEKLVFSQAEMKQYCDSALKAFDATGMDAVTLHESAQYGRQVGAHILAWAKEDHYKARESLPNYVLNPAPGKWKPTAPDYTEGVEPFWRTLRPFVLDSVSQFKPAPPTPVDLTPGSPFYKEMMEVYETVNDLRQKADDRLAIAKFWDCNPNISVNKGHVMYFEQKITPGGHWINIANIACQLKDLPIQQRAEVVTLVAIAVADGFISCWEEKYATEYVRPITVITENIDPAWTPILQTPPFPEYTSGHSVISASAAAMLTRLLGDGFVFTDNTELPFGMQERRFPSFLEAAQEASISRLYGGIHFRPALENGNAQGQKIGNFAWEKLKGNSQNTVSR
jgi:hypothetical protein